MRFIGFAPLCVVITWLQSDRDLFFGCQGEGWGDESDLNVRLTHSS